MSTLFSHFFHKINQISPLESDFTEVLDSIALKPRILYFYGKLPKNVSKNKQRPPAVAIVGSRHNTKYGEEITYKLAYELAKHGVIIVSGLAYGIDSIAHRGCLDAGGRTIAVLGTPIDKIYPERHLKLAVEILEKGGAILSEYAPSGKNHVLVNGPFGDIEILPNSASGHANLVSNLSTLASAPDRPQNSRLSRYSLPLPEDKFPLAEGESLDSDGRRQINFKTSFLYRNRLISGLSDIVVVTEAASHSGSLNTASHALEQGKELFAVPGNITAPYSQGCNRLIAQGALPYSKPDDILELLFPEEYAQKSHRLSKQRLIGSTPEETAVLQAIHQGLRRGEEIMRAALLPPEVFNQTITILEIKSRVRSLGANNWSLV